MKKKIALHIVESLNFGGVESRMKMIGLHAPHCSYEHRFCAISKGGTVAEELISLGRPVHVLNLPSKIPAASAIYALARHIHFSRPMVVHCHGAEANFHGLIAARLNCVPVRLGEEIGIPRHSRKARLVFKAVYGLADGVVAISQAVKDEIVRLGEAPAAKISRIYNPVIPQPLMDKQDRRGALTIGFVGRLEDVKNPLVLVPAIKSLRTRGLNVQLKLIGDGSQMPTLAKLANDLSVEHYVELAGYKPNPFAELSNCDLYVQPSKREGFGIAIVEAMTAGLPVIATAVGGAPEIIKHGETGWLLKQPTAEALADLMYEVLSLDTEERQIIAMAGRQSVLERFSVERYIEQCEALYDRILSRKGGKNLP